MGTLHKHKQSISFTKPQIEYLRAAAERLGITVGDMVRRIIDQHREADPSTPRGGK